MTSEGHTLLLISYENDTLQNVQLVFCKRLAINSQNGNCKTNILKHLEFFGIIGFPSKFFNNIKP